MKNSIFSIIPIFLFVFGFANTLDAQHLTTWKGGAPGKENDWNCPKNWSNSKVPDEFSNVVIPDVSTTSLAPPTIGMGVFEVNSIQLQSNATLTINPGAQLVVYNLYDNWIDKRGLINNGALLIINEAGESTAKNGFAQH